MFYFFEISKETSPSHLHNEHNQVESGSEGLNKKPVRNSMSVRSILEIPNAEANLQRPLRIVKPIG